VLYQLKLDSAPALPFIQLQLETGPLPSIDCHMKDPHMKDPVSGYAVCHAILGNLEISP